MRKDKIQLPPKAAKPFSLGHLVVGSSHGPAVHTESEPLIISTVSFRSLPTSNAHGFSASGHRHITAMKSPADHSRTEGTERACGIAITSDRSTHWLPAPCEASRKVHAEANSINLRMTKCEQHDGVGNMNNLLGNQFSSNEAGSVRRHVKTSDAIGDFGTCDCRVTQSLTSHSLRTQLVSKNASLLHY